MPMPMCELITVLRDHALRYPLMQPCDAVKLIYQNEFGGGHLIADPASCLDYLRREYAATLKSTEQMRCEQIGNGILRVHLAALPEEELEALGQAFLRSAAEHKGSMDAFLDKLELLRQLTGEGLFSFDLPALDAYLSEYKKAGCPAVSHSAQYRAAYHPAYRIIKVDNRLS